LNKPYAPASALPTIAGSCCLLALALVLIGFTDRRLNLSQNLMQALAQDNAPVMLPARDLLRERVTNMNDWHALCKRFDEARAALPPDVSATAPASDAPLAPNATANTIANSRANPKAKIKFTPAQAYLAAAYDKQDFIIKQMGTRDPRRAQLLNEVLTRLPLHPESLSAYADAISQDMAPQLSSNYAHYYDHVTAIAAGMDRPGKLQTLTSLAQSYAAVSHVALQRKTLEAIRTEYPLRFSTFPAMRSLLAIMPTDDPARPKLKNELDAYAVKRDQLIERSKWFASFDIAKQKNDLQAMDLALQGTLTVSDPFTAGALAVAADSHARAGHWKRARELRKLLIDADLDSFDETAAVIEYQSRGTNEQRRTTAMPPDLFLVAFVRWRGRIEAGILDPSPISSVQNPYFLDPPAWWENTITGELALANGSFDKLKPLAQFLPQSQATTQPPTSTQPATQPILQTADATPTAAAVVTSIDLRPVGSAVPADVHCNLRLTLDEQTLTVVVLADEPRTTPVADKAAKRDDDLSKEDSIELLFMPDRDPNWFLSLAVSTNGSITDVRFNGSPGQRYFADKSLDLGAKFQKIPSPPGTWSISLTIPRERIMPVGQDAIRFNARRNRVVPVGKSSVVQQYTWAPQRDGLYRPEIFGYLILPKPRD
jgi:hypothetical protein